jgi:hypothetical protein
MKIYKLWHLSTYEYFSNKMKTLILRYISLRMDGRVRGSGVGYPPWNAFVAQLPPLKGIWSGVHDGMDGRI